MGKRIETLANLAIVVTCLVLCALLANSWIERRNALAAAQTPTRYVKAGDRLPAELASSFKDTQKNLLLVFRSTCTFCTASMPFYKRLQTESTNAPGAVRFAGLTSEELPSAELYLKSHALSLASVSQFQTGQVSVRGTPALLLVDNSGRVLRVWTGRLTSALENDVIATVFHDNATN